MGKHSKKRRFLPQNQQAQKPTEIFRMSAHASSFSGPVPPPELLVKYNEAVPNAAERILAMAEQQATHRQNLEKLAVQANCSTQKSGPVFGFILCLVAIVGGIFLIYIGKSAEGLAAVIAPLAALATVFIMGRRKMTKELEAKGSALVETRKT